MGSGRDIMGWLAGLIIEIQEVILSYQKRSFWIAYIIIWKAGVINKSWKSYAIENAGFG